MIKPSEASEWIDPETFVYRGEIYRITSDYRFIKIGALHGHRKEARANKITSSKV